MTSWHDEQVAQPPEASAGFAKTCECVGSPREFAEPGEKIANDFQGVLCDGVQASAVNVIGESARNGRTLAPGRRLKPSWFGIAPLDTLPRRTGGHLSEERRRPQTRIRAKGNEMPFISVGTENSREINLYYEDYGTGEPVILIHGYPLSGRAWERQIPALLGAGYRVITYDRRGFGQSSQPWSGYNFETFAEDLHQLVTKLGLRQLSLVGHSMGGGEVARYMGKFGTRNVKKAVFISAIPPFLLKTHDNPQGIDGGVFDGIKHAAAADRPAFLAQFCADFYNVDVLGGKLVSTDDVQASWNISVAASPKGILDCVDAWLTDFREDLSRANIPILVIHGDSDRIVPLPFSGRRMPDFVKHAKLLVIKGGPHGIPWTHSDQVNRALLEG